MPMTIQMAMYDDTDIWWDKTRRDDMVWVAC